MGKLLHFPDKIRKLPAPSASPEPPPFPEFFEVRFDFDFDQFERFLVDQAELPPLEGD